MDDFCYSQEEKGSAASTVNRQDEHLALIPEYAKHCKPRAGKCSQVTEKRTDRQLTEAEASKADSVENTTQLSQWKLLEGLPPWRSVSDTGVSVYL